MAQVKIIMTDEEVAISKGLSEETVIMLFEKWREGNQELDFIHDIKEYVDELMNVDFDELSDEDKIKRLISERDDAKSELEKMTENRDEFRDAFNTLAEECDDLSKMWEDLGQETTVSGHRQTRVSIWIYDEIENSKFNDALNSLSTTSPE